jgi:PRTRC genetic system protein B
MIKNLNSRKLTARCALLVYKLDEASARNESGSNDQPNIRHFVTQHEITEKGQWGTGRPLTREALRDICMMVSPGFSELAFLEENVLAYLPGAVMLWWVPAAKRYLSFSEETKVKSGMAPVPAMLFMANPGTLSTWALNENRRPTLDTLLYNSPFYNVHEGGACCMGDIDVPKDVRIDNREKWEACFWNGTMTTDLPPELNGTTAMDLWNDLTSGKHEAFPVECLVPLRPLREVFELTNRRLHA